MRLVLDQGLFYEFIPVEELDSPNPTRHWIGTAETGVNYALVLTTCAGLWAYVIGDTVRLIDRDPPRLMITGRTSYSLSAFGEHLIGEEIEDAVASAAGDVGAAVTDYAVGALFPRTEDGMGGSAGRHLFIVEFEGGPIEAARLERFATALDRFLASRNSDYADHRAGDYGMRPPLIHPVPAGTFASWMKSRGRFGGQNKVPRIINDRTLLSDLGAFAGFPISA
ncbi:GH3 auxin-responsive promoter (fragment) [uncultured Defluviicoccus sp.]|uniref:GH3 auxin-responsive promoter n=1 Tax=metagenome TaxID=256318 RepID=A0A380THR0_9ZZZZ